MNNNCWIYNNKCLYEPPDGFYGFIYCIIDNNGKKYYGKKAFLHKKRKILSKKARKGTRKRIKVENIDSKWINYWGSSKPLLEYIKINGTNGFQRIILKLCKNRQSLAYWELHYLITEEVLFKDTWNLNVAGKYFKGKIDYL